jgi:hypothetical protein
MRAAIVSSCRVVAIFQSAAPKIPRGFGLRQPAAAFRPPREMRRGSAERGQPCPRVPRSRFARTRLSALRSRAALTDCVRLKKRQRAGAVQDAGATDERLGARRSRRFNVRRAGGSDISCVAGKWALKRAKARAPAATAWPPFANSFKFVCANFIFCVFRSTPPRLRLLARRRPQAPKP